MDIDAHNRHQARMIHDKGAYKFERRWYLIYCNAREEQTAARTLEREGYQVYLPMTTVDMRVSTSRIVEPLFARYLFINMKEGLDGDNWDKVSWCKGVSHVVKFGNIPASCPDFLIETLKEAETNGVLDSEREYKEGDGFRIKGGALDNIVGEILKMRGEDRVIFLLNGIETMVKIKAIEPLEV